MSHAGSNVAFKFVQALADANDHNAVLLLLHEVWDIIIEDGNNKPTTLAAVENSNGHRDSWNKRDEADAFLLSYLPPLGTFPHALLDIVYAADDIDDEVQSIADVFFTQVHQIYSCGALVSYRSTKQKASQTADHVWRLLRKIIDPVEASMQQLCDVRTWHRLFPERNWQRTSEVIVGWLVAICSLAETTPVNNGQQLSPESLLHSWTFWILDAVCGNQEHIQKAQAVVLLGTFLQRFFNRGAGDVLMNAILKSLLQRDYDSELLLAIPSSIQDAHAKEKFYRMLLLKLPQVTDPVVGQNLLRGFTIDSTADVVDNSVHYIMFQRLLLRDQLSTKATEMIVALLKEATREEQLKTLQQVAKPWSDKRAIQNYPLPRQAYLTFLLTSLLSLIPEGLLECGNTELIKLILEGVSNRLDSCLEIVRFQGMRVAHAMAAQQMNAPSVFDNLDVDFLTIREEEQWEEGIDTVRESPTKTELVPSEKSTEEADSDDESNFCDSLSDDDDDLQPIATPSETQKQILMNDQRPMTLIDVHQDLMNTEEPTKIINALIHLVILIKERPKELSSLSVELSRTLVHVSLPEWTYEELKKKEIAELEGIKSSSEIRSRCLALLLTTVPSECGDSVAMLIASRQLAEYQRLEILEAMRQAATALSSSSESYSMHSLPEKEESLARSGSSRVWGSRSLEIARKKCVVARNRFVDVIGSWTSSLLMVCQTRTHGFNIMERNHMVLGSVLTTIGIFAECAVQSIASTSLALTTFPLFKEVLMQKGNESCFLRRCAFQAIAALIKGIPTARLASILSTRGILQPEDEVDAALTAMFGWITDHMTKASRSDKDATCQHLAMHCLRTIRDITEEVKTTPELIEFRFPRTPSAISYRIPMSPDHLP